MAQGALRQLPQRPLRDVPLCNSPAPEGAKRRRLEPVCATYGARTEAHRTRSRPHESEEAAKPTMSREPKRTGPDRPSRSEPHQTEPNQSKPARIRPIRAVSGQAGPIKPYWPNQSEPSRIEPSQIESGRIEPERAESSRDRSNRTGASRIGPNRDTSAAARLARSGGAQNDRPNARHLRACADDGTRPASGNPSPSNGRARLRAPVHADRNVAKALRKCTPCRPQATRERQPPCKPPSSHSSIPSPQQRTASHKHPPPTVGIGADAAAANPGMRVVSPPRTQRASGKPAPAHRLSAAPTGL